MPAVMPCIRRAPKRFHLDPEPPDQEAAQHRAPVVARSADDHHHPDKEGEAQRLVGGRARAWLSRVVIIAPAMPTTAEPMMKTWR